MEINVHCSGDGLTHHVNHIIKDKVQVHERIFYDIQPISYNDFIDIKT